MNLQSEAVGALAREAIAALSAAKGRVAFREADSSYATKLAEAFSPRTAFRGRRKIGESPLSRFMQDVAFGHSDCWYWRKVTPQGYGQSYMLGERFAHRVSWRIHHGEIPEGMLILHKCDIRNCVNPDHLFLGTYADNHRDMVEKGRNPKGYKKPGHWVRGELAGNAKLTESAVKDIRALRKAGHSGASLARKYGVTNGLIYSVCQGRSWKHVGEEK